MERSRKLGLGALFAATVLSASPAGENRAMAIDGFASRIPADYNPSETCKSIAYVAVGAGATIAGGILLYSFVLEPLIKKRKLPNES